MPSISHRAGLCLQFALPEKGRVGKVVISLQDSLQDDYSKVSQAASEALEKIQAAEGTFQPSDKPH